MRTADILALVLYHWQINVDSVAKSNSSRYKISIFELNITFVMRPNIMTVMNTANSQFAYNKCYWSKILADGIVIKGEQDECPNRLT